MSARGDSSNMTRTFSPSLNSFESGSYREPRRLNLTLHTYAILGCDGLVIAVRRYAPIAPKNLSPAFVHVPDHMVKKVKPGWYWNRTAKSFVEHL